MVRICHYRQYQPFPIHLQARVAWFRVYLVRFASHQSSSTRSDIRHIVCSQFRLFYDIWPIRARARCIQMVSSPSDSSGEDEDTEYDPWRCRDRERQASVGLSTVMNFDRYFLRGGMYAAGCKYVQAE